MKHCALYYDSCLLIHFAPHHCCSPKKLIRSHGIVGSIYQTSHTALETPVRNKGNQQMKHHLRPSIWNRNPNHKKPDIKKRLQQTHTKTFPGALEIGSWEKKPRKFFLDKCWWAGCSRRKAESSVSWLYPHPKKLSSSFEKQLHQKSN